MRARLLWWWIPMAAMAEPTFRPSEPHPASFWLAMGLVHGLLVLPIWAAFGPRPETGSQRRAGIALAVVLVAAIAQGGVSVFWAPPVLLAAGVRCVRQWDLDRPWVWTAAVSAGVVAVAWLTDLVLVPYAVLHLLVDSALVG